MDGVLEFSRTGYLTLGASGGVNSVDSKTENLRKNGLNPEVLTGKEVNQRYPGLLNLPCDLKAVFDKDAGVLLAGKALRTIQVKDYFLPHLAIQ